MSANEVIREKEEMLYSEYNERVRAIFNHATAIEFETLFQIYSKFDIDLDILETLVSSQDSEELVYNFAKFLHVEKDNIDMETAKFLASIKNIELELAKKVLIDKIPLDIVKCCMIQIKEYDEETVETIRKSRRIDDRISYMIYNAKFGLDKYMRRFLFKLYENGWKPEKIEKLKEGNWLDNCNFIKSMLLESLVAYPIIDDEAIDVLKSFCDEQCHRFSQIWGSGGFRVMWYWLEGSIGVKLHDSESTQLLMLYWESIKPFMDRFIDRDDYIVGCICANCEAVVPIFGSVACMPEPLGKVLEQEQEKLANERRDKWHNYINKATEIVCKMYKEFFNYILKKLSQGCIPCKMSAALEYVLSFDVHTMYATPIDKNALGRLKEALSFERVEEDRDKRLETMIACKFNA